MLTGKQWLGYAVALRPIEIIPFAHFWLAAALARLGALDEAKAAARAGLALDPELHYPPLARQLPSDNPTYRAGRERFHEGMRIAGVPEG